MTEASIAYFSMEVGLGEEMPTYKARSASHLRLRSLAEHSRTPEGSLGAERHETGLSTLEREAHDLMFDRKISSGIRICATRPEHAERSGNEG